MALSWNANAESDLAGYNVYRGTISPVTKGTPLNGGTPVASPAYTDTSGTPGTPYYYAVTAVDTSANESGLSGEATGTSQTRPPGPYGLDLGSSGAYVTFGDPAKLDLATFTIETWFKKTGLGAPNSTGSGGIATFLPLVTHGGPESEGTNVDANWIFGINTNTAGPNVLAADFEEGPGGPGPLGQNHPVSGTTAISDNVWHHAAATWDGTTWRLYLDGQLDKTLAVSGGATPRSDTIQRAGLGVMLKSDGTPGNTARFQGVLDETRVWSVARTLSQIDADINHELTSGPVARWGFSEGFGTAVGDSIATAANGTLTGSGASWVAGAPFNIVFDTTPPAAPANVSAVVGNSAVILTWDANTEIDLAGYNVYRGTSTPVPTTGTPLNGGTMLTTARYADSTAVNGTTYHYVVTAVDTSSNKSNSSNDAPATALVPAGNAALYLNGTSQYVTFGAAPGLATSTFTIETWFNWTGGGTSNTTGIGGIPDFIPLLTKGSPEADNQDNQDADYILGIKLSTKHLAADMEEGATGTSPSLNHPIEGSSLITLNTWHHAAATYDGTTWKLYLDGVLDGTLVVGQPTRGDSIQYTALGTMLTSTGTANGFFQGYLDEARVWNYARSLAQVAGTKDQAVSTAPGLLGRWGLDEGAGATAADSSGHAINGTLTANPLWMTGRTLTANAAPAAPANLAATPGDAKVDLSWDPVPDVDLAGYNVYRSETTPVALTSPLNGSTLLGAHAYTDSTAVNGITYYYVVTAVDWAAVASGASDQVTATPQVAKIDQAISFTSTAPVGARVGDPVYTVTATGGGSGNQLVFTIDTSATAVCSISGADVSFTGVGTCVIDANQAGDATYNAAPRNSSPSPSRRPRSTRPSASPPPLRSGPGWVIRSTP